MNITTTTPEAAVARLNFSETWDQTVPDTWLRRQRNLRDLGPLAGENIVKAQ